MLTRTSWSDLPRRRRTAVRRISACMLLTGIALILAVAAMAQTRPPEPTVSLTVTDKPLVEALSQITRATGSEFEIDPAWQKVPVTAFIDNAPLSVALKRLLSGRNYAIVYLPQNRIKILIYEASPSGATPDRPPEMSSPSPRPSRAPLRNTSSVGQPESDDPMQNAPPGTGRMSPSVGQPESGDPMQNAPPGTGMPPPIRRPIGSPLN